ncbi:MAG: bacterial transcriptional activator domain-containing protein, partial [Desulfosarcinaceae bacterium]
GDTYRLRLGREGSVDMEIFTEETTRAAGEEDPYQAYCHCMKAVSVYEGDLLAEAPYCDWCGQTRQNLQNRYLHALGTIIAYHKKQEDLENCIIYAEKYLSTDRTAEKMYRDLMAFYAGTGNLPQVAATLNRCREALRRELDLPVEPETEALARRLLSREPFDSPPETAKR